MAGDVVLHPLAAFDLPRRAVNAFLRGGIATLEDAAEWSDDATMSMPHAGPRFVAALRAVQRRTMEH